VVATIVVVADMKIVEAMAKDRQCAKNIITLLMKVVLHQEVIVVCQ